jgi:MinD-like ATPase involved in chromosome partitioning or flagellar assembly
MTSRATPCRVAVLVAAAGAPWEAEALERLERPGSGVVLARRCLDLADLLATASSGVAGAAVVSADLPGLDADSVEALQAAGTGLVLVAGPAGGSADVADRMRRLGIDHQLDSGELSGLAELVRAATTEAVVAPHGVSESSPVGTHSAPPGRLLVVWGPAGAPGRTTLAVGLATEMAALDREVFLVDADPYGGAVAQHLGVLDEVSGLLAAARAANSGLLDADRLAGLAGQVGERLRVLTGLPRPDRWREVRAAPYDVLLREARRLAAYVVVDVGFDLASDPADAFVGSAPQRNLMTLAAVEQADDVVVVGAADPVGLARLARGLVELRDLVPDVRPRVVVNRTRPSLGWSDREIRGMVEGFVTPVDVHFLPDDRAAADRALMTGRSLAESGESPLRAGVAGVARALVGAQPAAPRRGSRVGRSRVRRRRAGRAP